MSIQLSKSASLRSGGGLVTPESRVNDVGINCNTTGVHVTNFEMHTQAKAKLDLKVQNIKL